MEHVMRTCRNHRNLRWSCKEIALTNGRYNGSRRLFYLGDPAAEIDERRPNECNCSLDNLIPVEQATA